MAEGFVLYVADSPHAGREFAGRARRLAVWGTLLLVIVAVSAMTARKSGSPVALKAGDKFVEEEHFEEKFLAKAASGGHPDRRNAKVKLVPAQRDSQARWQNVGARPENNIFNSRSSSSSSIDGPGGDAGAAADAMSAVAKARAELQGLKQTSNFIALASAPAWKGALTKKDNNVFDHSADGFKSVDDPSWTPPTMEGPPPLMADGRSGPRVATAADSGSSASEGFDIDTGVDDAFHKGVLTKKASDWSSVKIPQAGSMFINHVTDNGSDGTTGFKIDTSVDDFFTHHPKK